jgi:hypothetical protein
MTDTIREDSMGIKRILFKAKRRLMPTIDKWPIEKREKAAIDLYEMRCGYRFDLKKPETFSEKIIWYKLYYDHPDLGAIVDKYRFKEYIRSKLGDGYTLPLYGAYRSVQDLRDDWANLPKEFMLKSNLKSDGKFIMHIADKNRVNQKALWKELSQWLEVRKTLINSFCKGYYGATPLIIAEAYAENVAGQLYDYKAYCFGGNPYCICASVNHFGDEHYPITYYDTEWNKMDVRSGKHKNDDIPAPPHLSQMLELSRKLSAEFPFVRVDFFDTPEHLYLAELTFYPGGGLFQYDPPSFNKTMGDLFILPECGDKR